MKFKILLIFIIYYLFFSYLKASAESLINDKVIYNMEIGNDFIVYEYEKIIGDTPLHYLGLFNKKTYEFKDIKNNFGSLINDDMLFPSISLNDRYITFTSKATNITGDNINMCLNIMSYETEICSNIYIYDIDKEKTYMIKNNHEGLNGNSYISKISGDGNHIVFESSATNNLNFNELDSCSHQGINICVNIYKYNILTQSITLISTSNNNQGGNFSSFTPSISYDGRFITFQSLSTNFIANDLINNCKNIDEKAILQCSHIFLFDSYSKKINVISKKNNTLFNDNSGNAKISSQGDVVVYESYATNIENKYNNKQHVILYNIKDDTNFIISKNDFSLNNRDSYFVDVSYDGKYVLIRSNSTNLDEEGRERIYIYNTKNTKSDVFNNEINWATFNGNNIYYFNDSFVEYESIDKMSPVIEKNQIIYLLKDMDVSLKDKISVSDNLSERVDIFLDDNLILNNVGEYEVIVTAVDEFNNYSKESVKIVILEKDEEAPVFNELNEIMVLKGSSSLNLSNYLTAIDNVDGATKIYIIDDGNLNLNVKGKYKVKVMSKDTSENRVYKELEIVVYDNYDFTYIYEILIIIGIIGVIIFSIIKVK